MTDGASPNSLTIKSIRLENFRLYSNNKLNIDADLIIFIGSNGIGKTSVLEAIALLSNLKSFRGVSDKELIRHGADQYLLEIVYHNQSGSHKISTGYGIRASGDKKIERRMRYDGETIGKISDFIGKIQTVVFAPGDISILDSGPDERRRFVDIVLSSLHTEYLTTLQQYKKILKFRSSYFHKSGNKVDETYVRAINTDLINTGSRLQNYRKSFIDEFQLIFNKYVNLVSAGKDSWKIKYVPSVQNGHEKDIYKKSIEDVISSDIRYKQTTRGIHRDKLLVVNDDHQESDISIVGSQGQKRTAVLALKMAQYDYTKSRTSEKPVLLIDDVLNELDIDRRKKFINFLQDSGQAFITATDISALEDFIIMKKEHSKVQLFNQKKDNEWVMMPL